jgi:hypothetical protein
MQTWKVCFCCKVNSVASPNLLCPSIVAISSSNNLPSWTNVHPAELNLWHWINLLLLSLTTSDRLRGMVYVAPESIAMMASIPPRRCRTRVSIDSGCTPRPWNLASPPSSLLLKMSHWKLGGIPSLNQRFDFGNWVIGVFPHRQRTSCRCPHEIDHIKSWCSLVRSLKLCLRQDLK